MWSWQSVVELKKNRKSHVGMNTARWNLACTSAVTLSSVWGGFFKYLLWFVNYTCIHLYPHTAAEHSWPVFPFHTAQQKSSRHYINKKVVNCLYLLKVLVLRQNIRSLLALSSVLCGIQKWAVCLLLVIMHEYYYSHNEHPVTLLVKLWV